MKLFLLFSELCRVLDDWIHTEYGGKDLPLVLRGCQVHDVPVDRPQAAEASVQLLRRRREGLHHLPQQWERDGMP
jgi:hypothetical protein